MGAATAEWTVAQAAELYLELALTMIDDADDEDTIRPRLVLEALCPASIEVTVPDDLTVGKLRRGISEKRAELAREAVTRQ